MWTYSDSFYDASFYGPHGYEANNMPTRVWIAPDAFLYDDYGDTFLFVTPDTGASTWSSILGLMVCAPNWLSWSLLSTPSLTGG